ncbi:MAG: response regulator transcription factor [Niastella sp.]|nr:response regulator transcription factor [Niastella sp.]
MIRTILIDDEPDSTELLAMHLARYCPQVNIIGRYTSPAEGLEAIRQLSPELVLLDIQMPAMNGFDLIAHLPEINFSLIFITAYNEFALKAFRFNALDYLMKPVDVTELISAVRKAENKAFPYPGQLNSLQKHLRGEPINRLAVPHQQGVVFLELADILYAESSSNYTKLVVTGGRHFIISKTLGDVQKVLEDHSFLRVHRQYIVNLNRVKQFFRDEGNYLILDDGSNIPVGRNQKDRLVERFGWL